MMKSHEQERKVSPFEQITVANRRAITQAARANAMALRDVLLLHSHLLAFTARRLQCDIAAAEELADCSDAPEMAAVAQDFCAKAAADYAGEVVEFIRLSAKVANGAAASELAGAAK